MDQEPVVHELDKGHLIEQGLYREGRPSISRLRGEQVAVTPFTTRWALLAGNRDGESVGCRIQSSNWRNLSASQSALTFICASSGSSDS
eukprot:1822742-Ditylum_brightwellii.AAC.1